MKYYARLKIYKSNNVTFDPETLSAYSYDWWQFVRVINGKVVFNGYFYSPTTAKHQSKVRNLLASLNINIDVVVKTRAGLQACNGVYGGKEIALDAIREALFSKDIERAEKIAEVFKTKITKEDIQHAEETLCNQYLERAFAYSEKKLAKEQELKEFLDDLEVFKVERGSRTLIVAKSNDIVTFHISGEPENAVRREAEYCSPDAVAEICMNRLVFPLLAEEVVEISNFC